MCKYVLVIGVDVLFKICDFIDCLIIILFGDGVGVVVVGVSNELGIFFIYIYVDGEFGDLLSFEVFVCGGDSDKWLYMVGNEVFKVVVI